MARRPPEVVISWDEPKETYEEQVADLGRAAEASKSVGRRSWF